MGRQTSEGTSVRSILTTVTGTLVAAALVGTCLGGAAEPAAAAPTPTPTSSPAPQGATPAPTPTAAPEADAAAPDAAAPDAAVGAGLADDPSLAEMNAAQNHTMGSTIPTNDPQAKKDEAAREAAASTSSKREATTQSDDGASTQAQAQAAAVPPGVPGLDVSGWQENVDWNAVWAQGARFAYVKSTEGLTYRSGQFAQQYAGSYNVGMVRGAYHFARPDVSSGTAQADYFVANGGGWVGDSRTLPPLLDIEYNPYGETCYGMAGAAMVSWIAEFSARVQALTGARPAIYTTTDWWSRCTANSPAFGLNPHFIARYPANLASGAGTLPASWGSYTFWQYSSTGPFPGDSDVFNGSEATLRQLALTGLPMQQPVLGARDLDGDGRPDLLARRPDGTLWFYAGAGGSASGVAFVPGVQIGQGWGIFDQIIGAGDVTGDGKDDVLARKPDGSLWLYAGTGKNASTGAGLAAGVRIGVGWDVFTDVTAAGDLDGDGREDLLGRKPDGTLVRYLGAGSASYRPGVSIGTGWNVFAHIVTAGDQDGDGRDDLVGLRRDGSLSLYRSGGLVYQAGVAVSAPGLAGDDLLISAGDADGDGRSDLYARSSGGTLKFLPSTLRYDSAAFGAGQLVGVGWDVFRTVIGAGDLDGDGQPDIVAVGKDQALWFYSGYGSQGGVNRSYRAGVRIGQGWGAFREVVDAGDMNGDGTRDLLGARDDGTLWLYPGTGTVGRNGVAYGSPVRLDAGSWNSYSQFAVGDVDGNGTRDLLATKTDGVTVVFPGLSRTSASSAWFGTPATAAATAGTKLLPLGTGDANGDGKADLLATRPDGTLWLHSGTGSASGATPYLGKPLQVGSGWTIFRDASTTGATSAGRGGDALGVRTDGSLWYYPGTGTAGRGDASFGSARSVGAGWNVFG